MCTLWEEVIKESEARGELKGSAKQIVEMGKEFGLSDKEILQRLQVKLNLSIQQAKEYL